MARRVVKMKLAGSSLGTKFDDSGNITNFPDLPVRPVSLHESYYGSMMLDIVERGHMTRLEQQHLGGGPSAEMLALEAELYEIEGTPLEVPFEYE